ncbi:nudix-type nucleoside diphosphatase (YffH/AdpP family) [Roseateles asaccharophilus]|uniref:GDP-mannose pyrophosphatase n=1 Tax=Roseateles asaccharophilus TaxID=582607 RepID=A0ABU2A9Z6_9BURK|nr:ADP-ribose pyrophosphatase [Roseateles asaccharophilus]
MQPPTETRISDLPLSERVHVQQVKLLSDNWYTLKTTRFDFLRSSGDWQTQDRETYDRGNGATLLLYQRARRRVMLTRQFRYPVFVNGWQQLMVETVAGLLDEADPVSCIRAEAEQEAGVRLREVQPLFEAYMSPGSVTEKLHFFAAEYEERDLVGDGGGLVDEGEDIARFELDFDEAMRQVEAGEIVDAKTIMLLRWAERHVFGPPPKAGPLLVFIAGPYRSGTDDRDDLIAANVQAMQDAAVEVAALGHVPVLGEWVTLPLIEAQGGRRGDAIWNCVFHPHAQALLERCDLLLRIGGASAGADAMVKAALAHGLQVQYGTASLPARPA